MPSSAANLIPISLKDLQKWIKQADARLARVDSTAKKRRGAENIKTPLMPTITSVVPQTETVSLVKIALEESQSELLPSEMILHVLHNIRTGLLLAFHFDDLYTKASGLDLLMQRNKTGKLPVGEQAEFHAKVATRAAIAVYVFASYVAWDLSAYYADEVSSVSMDVYPPEISFENTVEAINSTLVDFGLAVNAPTKVNGDLEFVKFSLLYFRKVIEAVKTREFQLLHKESFTQNKYKLEGTEFVLDGFHELNDRTVVSVDFNVVRFEEIVGNRAAKHNRQRLIQRLLCYDLGEKKNPMRELKGLSPVEMGHGFPGTGKSMMIAATATELKERCEWLGIPFLFHPLPDNIVSTFQGGSAERMTDWMRVLRDPSKIIYAPIDDAENTFEERTRQGVSAGVREVIGVFLRNTEGAYAVNFGNTVLDICTNIPEQIDKAVLSRIVSRYVIDGARSEHDFIDQDHSCYRQYEKMSPGFLSMEHPDGYTYMDDQRKVSKLNQLSERYVEAKELRVREIVERVMKKFRPKQERFFGTLFVAVKETFPMFTSRDVRNIQMAVTSRILDFDFPAEWLDDPVRFFKKTYEEKMGMLTELMKMNMTGLAFHEIRLEETLRYLDSMVVIADKDRERKITVFIEEADIRAEAQRRLEARQRTKTS